MRGETGCKKYTLLCFCTVSCFYQLFDLLEHKIQQYNTMHRNKNVKPAKAHLLCFNNICFFV